MDNGYLSIKEAQKILHLSLSRVHKIARDGKIKSSKCPITGQYRFLKKDILDYLEILKRDFDFVVFPTSPHNTVHWKKKRKA